MADRIRTTDFLEEEIRLLTVRHEELDRAAQRVLGQVVERQDRIERKLDALKTVGEAMGLGFVDDGLDRADRRIARLERALERLVEEHVCTGERVGELGERLTCAICEMGLELLEVDDDVDDARAPESTAPLAEDLPPGALDRVFEAAAAVGALEPEWLDVDDGSAWDPSRR